MASPQLLIAGTPVGFDRVWVHLKPRAKVHDPKPYVAAVPLQLGPSLFDPHGTKAQATPWSDHLWGLTEELGTFFLDGAFQALWRHTTTKPRRFEWVVASLDEIREDAEFVYFGGQAERFDTSRFAEG
ncbi:MAG TPA: hypothetical protein VKE74_26840 [Gemmataceae bacterium]|nr:hypothetical protein [Gemmataceae bacterium]